MAYTHYEDVAIDGATDDGATILDKMRQKLDAMRDACIMGGGFFGWPMTPSGGTADAPTVLTYSNGTERVRATLTYDGAGMVTQALYEYSSTSGASWDTIKTKTINYDGDYMVTGTTWS